MNRHIVMLFSLCFMTAPLASQSIVIAGSGADLATFGILTQAFQRQQPQADFTILPSIGSGGAVRGVLSGRVDLGLLSRPLKDKERQHNLIALNYADTALVFVTSPGYPADSIDLDTLKAIYRGEANDTALKPILRPHSDSDTLLLYQSLPELAPALESAYQRKGLPITLTDQLTIEMAQKMVNAIATSTLSAITTEAPALRVLALNDVVPDHATISNGQYPLKKSLFLIHDGNLTPTERQFIEFILSAQGRRILAETGHFFSAD